MSRKTRNLIWSVPLVATLAIVGALAVFVALAPNQIEAQGINVPSIPLNLEANADGATRIELTWDDPDTGGEAIGFRIDASDDGKTWRLLESSHPDPRYVHEGLLAKQMQHYRVFAFNADGSSLVAGPISATTTASIKPKAPMNLVLSLEDAADGVPEEEIILTWEPPDDQDGAPVTHYRIERSKTGTRWSNLKAKIAIGELTFAGDEYSYPDKGLLEYQEWYYRVSAINSEGQSTASNAPKMRTMKGDLPGAPQNLFAGINPESTTTIWLYWDEPITDPDDSDFVDLPGAPINGYLIQGRPRSGDLSVPWSADASKNLLVEVGETTDFEITNAELRKVTADFPDAAGDGDGKKDAILQWDFRVFAVNTVVERDLDDPTTKDAQLAVAAIPTEGFNASNLIYVNPIDLPADVTDDLMTPPTGLDADRASTVNSGRTEIILEWKAPVTLDDMDPKGQIANEETIYRIEFSTDRIDWSLVAEATHPNLTINHLGRIAGTTYNYRVFAKQLEGPIGDAVNAASYTWASRPIARVATAPALRPMPPTDTISDTVGHTQIDLTWIPPDDVVETVPDPGADGSDPVGNGKITNYMIEKSDDGSSWSELVTIGPEDDKVYTYDGTKVTESASAVEDDNVIDFRHTKLMPGMTIHYRISTINNAPTNQRKSRPSDSVIGMTEPASEPDAPGGLVVQAYGQTAAKLCWNEQSADTAAAPTSGYRIDISDDAGETWTRLVEDTESTNTMYTDMGLSAGSVRHYRVYAINSVGTSPGFTGFDDGIDGTNDNDAVVTTDLATAPGAPVVTAAADSDTEITVTWTAPADGGSVITGYVLQRAYKGADDTMTDFMTIAATDAATWWNTLGCPMMNAAIPDDATPAPPADDADTDSPYCAMYDGLAADAEEEVDAVFAANYGTITDTSYMDTGLMPETAYYYRVAAMNSAGMGEYSDGMDMATTEATDTVPGVATAVTAMETSDTEITVTWGSPASDGGADITGYMVQRAYMGADNMKSEWMDVDPAHMGMDMEYMDTGLMPETMYYYQVRAMNAAGNGEWSDGMASAMTMATATSTELTAPSDVLVSTLANTQSVSVTWDTTSIQNAEQIKVVLYNSDVTALAQIAMPLITINPANDAGSATFNNVPDGTYYVTVASFRTGERHKLSPLQEVTVE